MTALKTKEQNLVTLPNRKLAWYDDARLQIAKSIFGKDLNDLEFTFFVDLAKACNLNPFKKEIWATKHKANEAAQIYIGINGYRMIAHRNKNYEWHQVDAVYENDKFGIADNVIMHNYALNNRGKLVGAYCMVKRKNAEKNMFVFVEFEEYNKKYALWKPANQGGKPATMIKKIAEAQALRMAFSDELNGTYIDEEDYTDQNKKIIKVEEKQIQTERLKNIIEVDSNTGEIIDENITQDQINQINYLIFEKDLSVERINKAMNYYKVDNFEKLTSKQAALFIGQLERI
jgi:phage recombination protein Bet